MYYNKVVLMEMRSSVQISCKTCRRPDLHELQVIVDGYIEIVNLKNGYVLVVNDEGAINGICRYNPLATALYGNFIFGQALLCKVDDLDSTVLRYLTVEETDHIIKDVKQFISEVKL